MLAKLSLALLLASLPWSCLSDGHESDFDLEGGNESDYEDAFEGDEYEWTFLECQGDQMPCIKEGFDADGFPTFEEFCSKAADTSGKRLLGSSGRLLMVEDENDTDVNESMIDMDDYYGYDYDYEEGPMCPITCGEGAQMCGTGFDAVCVPKEEQCPIMCGADKPQLCFVDEFDADGELVDYKEQCVAEGAACPCGANAKSCTEDGFAYCIPAAESCPVSCTDEQKECSPVSFTAEGELDESGGMSVTCVAMNETCTCGANAQLCTETDPDFGTFEWCEPKTIDGEANACPVECAENQQICTDFVFDNDGEIVDFKDTCIDEDKSCPCGAESNKCADEMGEYCLPKSFGSCPVECTEEQEYCYVDSFDIIGEWIGTDEVCVAKGASCDCSKGTNAKSCTFSDPLTRESWTECIFKDEYCPVQCSAGQVQCPEVEEFDAMGEFLKAVAPKKACASKLGECACGKGAQRCSEGEFSWCQPKLLGCPVTCKKGTKECYLDNYNSTGHFKFSQGKCVKETDPCPCGTNAKQCADGMCIPKTEACDCKTTEKSCSIADYAKDGTTAGFKSICVAKNAQCPCGKNSKRCKGTAEGDDTYCIPKGSKDGKAGECPKYCTPEELFSGKMNCVQTNLDKNGGFVSQVIKCVEKSKCKPGRNMKQCPSGAVISVKDKCTTLYAVSNSTKKTRSSDETATIKFEVDSTQSDADAAKAAKSMMVAMNSALQLPSDLTTDLTMKAPKKKGRRLTGSGKKEFTYTVKNTGSVKVSPSQVAAQAKTMIKKKSPQIKKATRAIGSVSSSGVYSAVQSKKSVKANRTQMKNSVAPTPAPTQAPTAPTAAPTPPPTNATAAPTPPPTSASTTVNDGAVQSAASAQLIAILSVLVCLTASR